MLMKQHLFFNYFWLLVGVVYADYQFELQLLRYQNPSHRLAATERCCDSDEDLRMCKDHCDNTLEVCLSSPGQADCSLGLVSTGTLFVNNHKGDKVMFSGGGSFIADGVKNPLVFTGYEWPGGFELFVRVTDEDDGGVVEEVDRLPLSEPMVRPMSLFSSAVEIRGNGGRGFLRLNYRLTCTGNYTGNTCTTSLCSTGECRDVCTATSPCENDGVCTSASHTKPGYMCSCPPQFGGSRCEIETMPHTTTPPHPAPSAPAIAVVPSTEAGSEQGLGVVAAVAVVASCVLVVMGGLVLLLLGIVVLLLHQRRRQRHGGQASLEQVSCKRSGPDEDMYDNPTYMNSTYTERPADSVLGGEEAAVYLQPAYTRAREEAIYQQPAVLDTRAGGEGAVYRKVINPLYYSQSPSTNPDPSCYPSVPEYCNVEYQSDPYYATPFLSGPHSHSDMEHEPEGTRK